MRFLEVAAHAVAEALGPDAPRITAIRARSEDLAHAREGREAWDVVVVRAVGSLAEIVELGLPLLRVGGELIAWKRDDPESPRALDVEIETARSLIKAIGGRLEAVDAVQLEELPGHVLVTDRQGPRRRRLGIRVTRRIVAPPEWPVGPDASLP